MTPEDDVTKLEEIFRSNSEGGLLLRIRVLAQRKADRTGEPMSMVTLMFEMLDDVVDLWEEDEDYRETSHLE